MTVFLGGKVEMRPGDCRDVIRAMPDCSVDSVVTDPPYALVSIQKRFGKPGSAPAKDGKDGLYARASAGFMGKQWDTGETAFAAEFWAEVLRVLKPGGHVVAFSGTRTYHRMAVAIEDAGFEIRDQLAWAYGSGFPKSHDVSKGIDKAAGAEREVVGTVRAGIARSARKGGEFVGNESFEELKQSPVTLPATTAAREWQGWGTALKPAWEPICLARKPLIGTVAENVLQFGTGALNVDGCRVATDETIVATRNVALGSSGTGVFGSANTPGIYEQKDGGRWPANIVHDGSDEVVACFPDTESGSRKAGSCGLMGYHGADAAPMPAINGDSGSAARFFYTAKADKMDRIGSKHPTVKPVDLMQWLCRMVTPPGGLVLDPFAGSGSTGEAAWREGFRSILIEREEEYQADITERLRLADAGPMERKARAIKQSTSLGPLFGDNDNAPAQAGAAHG